MDLTADQAELFPVIAAQPARRRSALAEWIDAVEKHGPLLPQSFLPHCLNLTKQRVSQLMQDGLLASIEVAGKRFVPVASLELFLGEERKLGRPVKQLNVREVIRTFKNS